MRFLIDGYNVMHAVGLMKPRFGPDEFRKVRHRFLNDLAAGLDPVDAQLTTVVFDAAKPPVERPRCVRHKALTVLFAVEDDTADDRMEAMIARHSAPKSLTVVSSDRRIRDAASRRRAKVLTSDDFWDQLQEKTRRKPDRPPAPPSPEERARLHGPTAAEASEWLEVFGDLDTHPDTRTALSSADFVPTDDEIERIRREVEREGDRPPRGRGGR